MNTFSSKIRSTWIKRALARAVRVMFQRRNQHNLIFFQPCNLFFSCTGCLQPVQPPGAMSPTLIPSEFQSSPAVSSRCNYDRCYRPGATASIVFQSSPAVSSRCNADSDTGIATLSTGFNPHRLSPAGATQVTTSRPRYIHTSFNPHRLSPAGATLSAAQLAGTRSMHVFQSSPAVSSRCNDSRHATFARSLHRFQSSPASPAGATRTSSADCTVLHAVSILTGCLQPVQLHTVHPALPSRVRFQSSPAVSSRCNVRTSAAICARLVEVSILTGCLQPVQRSPAAAVAYALTVSILTGCLQPVQLGAWLRPRR